MSDDQDDSQKTEEPTQRRLEEAVKRGQVVSSREVSSFAMLLAFTLILAMVMPTAARMTYQTLSIFITAPHSLPTDEGALRELFLALLMKSLLIMGMVVIGLVIAALGGTMIQRRITFSFESIMPKLEKISPIKGFGRIFSQRNVVELIKGTIKIIIIGVIAALAVRPYLKRFRQLPAYEPTQFLGYLDQVALKMLIAICISMAVIAVLDYLYQRFEYLRNLRMSRHELRQEFKEQEGDPHIKAKVKAIRTERARKRMMSHVPTADVVITNPTHFSVALKYDSAAMRAPQLVAKGQDLVALKIREIAEENKVPIVENPPLARALHANVKLEEEIPTEYYQAVAEVISYVYRLKGKLK